MFPEQRRREILQLIEQAGSVSVAELSEQFDVSEVTIRADLQALAETGDVVRTHGGAILGDHGLSQLSLTKRLKQQVAEKKRIGVTAAERVSDGEAIILDSSTTTLAIAHNLKAHRDLTIITNSLPIAQEMLDASGITIIMLGGRVRRDTASIVEVDDLERIRGLNIQAGFFGAHGITVEEGLTDVSVDEAEVKRPLIKLCNQVVVVLDATKWGRVGLASFADLDQVDEVITDVNAPEEQVEDVTKLNIPVTLV